MTELSTEMLYLTDAYQTEFTATVTAIEGDGAAGTGEDRPPRRLALDRTAFYATGGGQPHDVGTVTFPAGTATITAVTKQGETIWHTVGADDPLPAVGDPLDGLVDWDRRHSLMRTHTAMHILCGVIWNEYGTAVTGGNMEPLSGRMDFEFDPLPEGFATRIEELVNAEIVNDRPIEISFLERTAALADPDLIRTKVNLIPESVREIRVVDIVGLDKQADGGTHVRSTGEVGTFTVVKTESKGKGNKRIRVAVSDA